MGVIAMVDYRRIIREKRRKLGMSQNQLAKLCGISQPFVNEIESGRKSPSAETLFQICEVLQIPVFGEEWEKETPDAKR